MKTVLFFYFDIILKETKCDCYLVQDVQKCIDWRTAIYIKEMKRNEISNLTIKVVDKINFSTMTKM